jgi:hypothetical protein
MGLFRKLVILKVVTRPTWSLMVVITSGHRSGIHPGSALIRGYQGGYWQLSTRSGPSRREESAKADADAMEFRGLRHSEEAAATKWLCKFAAPHGFPRRHRRLALAQ